VRAAQVLPPYKLTLVSEPWWVDGFLSERLVQALLAGTVPVYAGVDAGMLGRRYEQCPCSGRFVLRVLTHVGTVHGSLFSLAMKMTVMLSTHAVHLCWHCCCLRDVTVPKGSMHVPPCTASRVADD